MRTGLGRSRAIAAATVMAACLDRNPKFEEPPLPTASDTEGGTTMVGMTTATVGPTSSATTGAPGTSSGSADTETLETTDTSGTPVCGDGIAENGEECDEGPGNDDAGACTTTCKLAVCGDGLRQEMVEACDDGNLNPNDGCVACVVPKTCKEILGLDGDAPSGDYVIDADGDEGEPVVTVPCDMDTTDGGWTIVERSPRLDPIGRALFFDVEVLPARPGDLRHRLGRATMEAVMWNSSEMRIDCRGGDYLLAAAEAVFSGDGATECAEVGKVFYKEARLKDRMHGQIELCTGFLGSLDGCEGAWSIDETNQGPCDLPPFPWDFMVPVTSDSADAFAVDPATADQGQPPPIHDCHVGDAVRVVMLR